MRHTTLWTDLLLGLCVLAVGVMFVAFGPVDPSELGAAGLGGTARLAFGFLGLLLVPGYAAAAALFPGRSDIDPVSRGALSLGLSVAAVPLVALLLNQTPWGIRPLPMALGLLLLSLLLSGAAIVRRVRAAVPENAGQEETGGSVQHLSTQHQATQRQSGKTTQLRPVHSGSTQVWATRVDAAQARGTHIWESPSAARRPPSRPRTEPSRYARPLLFGLLAMTVAIGLVGGLTIQQRAQQSFTEFYLLGSAGKLSAYPYRVQAGQPFEVRLGVLNRERLAARYTIRTAGCGQGGTAAGRAVSVPKLEPGQEWQGRLQCRVGAQTTALNFQLVRGGSLEAYRTLSLRLQPGVPAN